MARDKQREQAGGPSRTPVPGSAAAFPSGSCRLLKTLVAVSSLIAAGSVVMADPEVFWRETATEKIKIIVEGDRVVSRWVFVKKTVHGDFGGAGGLELGKPFTNEQGMSMAWIPAGSFVMGSPPDEPGRMASEGPQRTVTFPFGFFMGINELSQAQYSRIMGENPSRSRNPFLPVERVSWRDAVNFCKKLTARERAAGRLPLGYVYRLPTEAEWEYACRAGSLGARYGALEAVAWYGGNSSFKPHRIGRKMPNAWGLCDMIGNVSEWCFDSWTDDYRNAPAIGWKRSSSTGELKVYRGGSYLDEPEDCRAAARKCAGRRFSDASPDRGFRCVLTRSTIE